MNGCHGVHQGLAMIQAPGRCCWSRTASNAAHVLAKGLREQSYAVDLAADGEAAVFQAATTDYDAVVLDVMLPKRDGFAVCRTIRESGCAVPILMVTARDAVESRIEGLDCGADDSGRRSASVQAARRARAHPARPGRCCPEHLTVGRLVLDTRGRHVCGGHQVRLTLRYALLEYFGPPARRSQPERHRRTRLDEHYDPLSTSSTSTCSAFAASWARPGPSR